MQKYQEGKESIGGSEFVCDSIDLFYYHLQWISLKRGGSYVDSPKWLKNKKATINPKNNDNNCFQYALTAAVLMIEKDIWGGICHEIHRHAKANNKYMKNYDKKIDSSCSSFYCSHKSFKQALNHGLIFKKVHKVIQHGWGMSQKLPVNSFKWIKKLSKSDERFMKDHDENSSNRYFLEVDVE